MSHSSAPVYDRLSTEEFKQQIVDELEDKMETEDPLSTRYGMLVHQLAPLVSNASLPVINSPGTPKTATDALIMTQQQFKEHLETGEVYPGVISFRMETQYGNRPGYSDAIEDFFEEFDDNDLVVVQDLALDPKTKSFADMPVGEIKQRLASNVTKHPINGLDCRAPHDFNICPQAFGNVDCNLLNNIKHSMINKKSSTQRLGYPSGWVDVAKWALFAQRGALTGPHQDSHGFGTFLTVNQGQVGFAWLSKPTDNQLKDWAVNQDITVGRWCFMALSRGQAVYFPPGTVHCVVRSIEGDNTLLTGGHILRRCAIARWAQICHLQNEYPNVTNEDVDDIAEFMKIVAGYVKEAEQKGTLVEWGGESAVAEFKSHANEVSIPYTGS
jgi:hypothetical protein